MSTPWRTEHWFVSPWNYLPEVRATLNLPGKVEIHDVTLRDGEQQAGIIFTKDEKIRIAESLAEVGVHRIEAGMPAVSRQDTEAVKEIARRKLGPKIFAFARCMKEDVDRALECGVDGVVVEIPSSIHMIERAYRWPLEKAIELSIEATRYAHENGLYTVFFPIDFSRADFEWVMNLIERVATEGHMDALAVVDTFGGLSPHAVPWLIRNIKRRIDKPLEVHFHDDFGMGVANTIMAVAAGAEVVHTTITGLGERAGNAAYEELVLALLTMYGLDLGIRTEKLTAVSRLVQEITGQEVPWNRAVVGKYLTKIESGIIAGWYRNVYATEPTLLMPYAPELVGQEPADVVLGKNSGAESIGLWLQRMGRQATEEQVQELVDKVKEWAYVKHGLLDPSEFRQLVDKVLG